MKERTSIGKDKFPKTLTLVINILSTHQYNKDKDDIISREGNSDKQTRSHDNKNENDKKIDSPTYTIVTMEYQCYCCGETGHKSQ